ncbi:MAG: orotidine-5'-phosphate decarboxylase, partial [Planctomycetales bacterium]|nr:orotidine-5'-phosphate decarboxylase [Planctomycetales bacterium]
MPRDAVRQWPGRIPVKLLEMDHSMPFGDQLAQLVQQKKSAVCVGLDPRWASLPETIRGAVDAHNTVAVAAATQCYCQEVIDAVAGYAPLIKPQAAFFELLGPAGMQALAAVIQHARRAGLLVLLDGKRGDIGSTAEGYAHAYLGKTSVWQCDALTVNPYLGDDTLQPFVKTAEERQAGIFVLVKTSNPGSNFLQDQPLGDGQCVYHRVGDLVQSLAQNSVGVSGYGQVGAVVGATYPQQLAELRQRMPQAWILIPGYGAQGGTAEDVAHGFDARGLGAVVNSSRGIIFAYSQPQYQGLPWQ